MAQAKEQHSKAFKEGLKIRQEVLGDTYIVYLFGFWGFCCMRNAILINNSAQTYLPALGRSM